MTEKYDNSGALFKNQRKDSDRHPDYTGSITVDGTEYWLSGWKKTSRKGDTFLSVAVRRKEEQRVEQPEEEIDDDLDW